MAKLKTKEIIKQVESSYINSSKIIDFRTGDIIRVFVKVVEGESERVQTFEGVVIRKRGGGLSQSFTVRKVSFGIGIERTFPLYAPRIEKIELVRSTKTRRARLYYLRNLSGKAARLTDKEDHDSGESAKNSAPIVSNEISKTKMSSTTKDSPEVVASR